MLFFCNLDEKEVDLTRFVKYNCNTTYYEGNRSGKGDWYGGIAECRFGKI